MQLTKPIVPQRNANPGGKGDGKGEGSGEKSKRHSEFSKKYKKIQTNYAEEFGKKGIPMERSEKDPKEFSSVTKNEDIDWFFGYRGQGQARWNRLHAGMTPRQIKDFKDVKDEDSKAIFAPTAPAGLLALDGMNETWSNEKAEQPAGRTEARRSLLLGEAEQKKSEARNSLVRARTSVLLDETQANVATTKARRSLKETVNLPVSECELKSAEPLVPLTPTSFPPISARRPSASSMAPKCTDQSDFSDTRDALPAVASCKTSARPGGAIENSQEKKSNKKSHYAYFAKICPLDFDKKRRIDEQKADMLDMRNAARPPNLMQTSRILPEDSPRVLMQGASKSLNVTTPRSDDANGKLAEGNRFTTPSNTVGKRNSAGFKDLKGSVTSRSSKASSADGDLEKARKKEGLTPGKKAACEGLRLTVYGKLGNELAKTQKEADAVFELPRGTEREIIQLYHTWREMDSDDSGEISFREMLVYFRSKGLSIVGERAMKGIFGTNESRQYSLDDLMRVMWPRCTDEDMAWMKDVICDFRSAGHSDVELKELTLDLMEELRDAFAMVDISGSGKVTISGLRNAGMVFTQELLNKWGISADGELGLKEFMQVMCPAGHFVPKKLPASIARGPLDNW